MRYSRIVVAAALSSGHVALAQTFTDCNPLEKTCPDDVGFLGTSFKSDFTGGSDANGSWSGVAYTAIDYGNKGAEFTIAKAGQAPTIQTDFYIFFGKVEVVMQAAPGQGIVSSIVLESEDLDEIDWEFLGGDTTQVQTNYFGKGNTTTYDRAIYYPISSPQTTFHTYTIDWTSEYIKFMVDGAVLRTLNYQDANGGANFPQTPMRLKLGNWAGGAPGNAPGTIEWAGGATDFSKAPFTMYVKSVSVTNYNPATAYKWTDRTGSWQSIKIIKDGESANVSAVGPSATAPATSLTNTRAPTRFLSVKQVQQTAAAVSSTSKGAGPSTTIESMMSSSVPMSSVYHNGTANHTTMASAHSASTNMPVAGLSNTSSGSSASKTAASGTASSSATSSNGSAPVQQTTNGAAANGVATTVLALGSIAFALVVL